VAAIPPLESLREVAALVHQESGVTIGEAQFPLLASAIGRIEPGLDAPELLRRCREPLSRSGLIDRLIDQVTIKETYFLRHRDELEAIDWRSLLAAARREGRSVVRAWSAACASGEEPYSLALLASEVFAERPAPVSILASDIAASSISRAQAAHYGPRSLRNVSDEDRARYFTPEVEGLRVTDELRGRVRFLRHNLVRDPIPPAGEGAFDLIVCRNVFIYFRPETVTATIDALERCLRPHGVLVLGAADRLASPPRGKGAVQRTVGPRRAGQDRRRSPAGSTAPSLKPVPLVQRRARDRRERPELDDRRPETLPEESVARTTALLAALHAADTGRLSEAISAAEQLLANNPLDEVAHYIRGLAELAAGDRTRSIADLRRALYVFPNFALAAYALAGAHDAEGDPPAARRAYRQALRLLKAAHPQPEPLPPLNTQDLARACEARLARLGDQQVQ
jgi:chemotaxis protein methyltransferase CheR